MIFEVGDPFLRIESWELFANDSVRTLRDLKGKTVAAPERSSRQAFVAGLATYVGLNPSTDILQTAKLLGLEVPSMLLARADEVIE